jgi:hypothetical protein
MVGTQISFYIIISTPLIIKSGVLVVGKRSV